MKKAADSNLLRQFAETVARGMVPAQLRLVFGVSGGLPHEKLDHSLTLNADGSTRVRYEDHLRKLGPVSAVGTLSGNEMLDFLTSIARGKDGLVFADEALFVPGAVTGRVSLEIAGQSETYWFGMSDPDDDAEDVQDDIDEGYHLAPQLNAAVALFEQHSKRLRAGRGD